MNKYLISALLSVIIFSSSQTVIADPFNTSVDVEMFDDPTGEDEFQIIFEDPDGLLDAIGISNLGEFRARFSCSTTGDIPISVAENFPFTVTVRDCQEPADETVWEVTSTEATCISPSCFPRVSVGGEMFPVDTTSLLLAATYSTSAWLIPLLVTAVGFGIIITKQKTKLKNNSCPSCKLETEDFFELGDKVVSKCENPKCRVNLFFIRRYRNSFN